MVIAQGYDSWGQSDVPDDLANVVAITAGGDGSLALTRDGRLVPWGADNGRQSLPTELANVSAIAGGYAHDLARPERHG